MKLRVKSVFIAGLMLSTAWLFSSAVYIHAKAGLAQHLLEKAWQEQKVSDAQVPPWPWADTWPVARLSAERTAMDQIILANASGRNLAFGPTLVSTIPNRQDDNTIGHVVISAHRDTHFKHLGQIQIDDALVLETRHSTINYRVTHTEIIDLDYQHLWLQPESKRLTLVTCYPFDAINPGTSKRYLVHASATAPPNPTSSPPDSS